MSVAIGKRIGSVAILGAAVVALAVVVAGSASSCSQTPTNNPVVTFEGADKAALVCLDVTQPNGSVPLTQDHCALVPSGIAGSGQANHLIATVTQTTRGELAVVDLTAGDIVDIDYSTPGFQFVPVGPNPSDVAIPPDGQYTYVSSANSAKPAIYTIDNRFLLGDSTVGNTRTPPLQLTDLKACLLPAPPRALAISPNPAATGDAGADAGGDAGTGQPGYSLLALLDSAEGQPARVVAIDPSTLQAQSSQQPGMLPPCTLLSSVNLSTDLPPTFPAGPPWPDGVPYVDGGVDLVGQLPPIAPAPVCGTTLNFDAGVVAIGDAGTPPLVPMGFPPPSGDEAGVDDAGTDEDADAGAPVADATAPVADAAISALGAPASDGGFALPPPLPLVSTPVGMVLRDDQPILYVADGQLPVIHVLDVHDPTHIVERPDPLLATSVTQPTRQVHVGALAFSPATRDYKRYLYAVDEAPPSPSLMVYDVTNPDTSPHVPLTRPHAELNPFAPSDRIVFAAGVASVSFVTHDWPVTAMSPSSQAGQLAYQGLLCNPNPGAHPNATTFNDFGAYYRVDQASVIQPNGTAENFPSRLRGVFAFAALTNGSVVAVDVDDWDAPCRRPDPMTVGEITGSLDVPQVVTPLAPGGGFDPYGVPTAYSTDPSLAESPAVTLEPFFPVSAPNRLRSSTLVRNDPTTGLHSPALEQPPQLSDVNGAPVVTGGTAGSSNPILLPTALQDGWRDPSTNQTPTEPNPAARTYLPDAGVFPDPTMTVTPGVRLSFDDPTAQVAQDWTVTYEGVVPSSSGIVATVQPQAPGDWSRLTFSTQGANFCGLGIEDAAIGQARANAAVAEMNDLASQGAIQPLTPAAASLPTWTADYVVVTDNLLAPTDQYWTLPQACWDNQPQTRSDSSPSDRYNFCQSTFGAPGTNPDLVLGRDFPILEAYADHLVVGRWGYPNDVSIESTQSRTIDPGSPNNATFLKALQCCFHSSAGFKVRTGGEWVAVGQQSVGLLHHVVASQDPSQNQRCVLSCEPRDVLLNARSFDVPWASASCTSPANPPQLDRNDPLAMRNPSFAYITWAGCGAANQGTTPGDAGAAVAAQHTLTARDLTWRFTVEGGFSPLTIPLSGTTNTPVSPRSMIPIGPLGQLGIVDGANQGFVVIDLDDVAVVADYF